MRSSFKDYIQESDQPISESLIAKGFAIAQSRAHANNKIKFQSALTRIQSNAKKGLSETDEEKRVEILFSVLLEFASALKIASDMSTNSVNISTASVLFAEDIRKALISVFPK